MSCTPQECIPQCIEDTKHVPHYLCNKATCRNFKQLLKYSDAMRDYVPDDIYTVISTYIGSIQFTLTFKLLPKYLELPSDIFVTIYPQEFTVPSGITIEFKTIKTNKKILYVQGGTVLMARPSFPAYISDDHYGNAYIEKTKIIIEI